jgi:integrase
MRLRKVGGSSRQRADSVFRTHVDPVFGHRKVGAIRPTDVLEWLGGPVSKRSGSIQEAAWLIVACTFDMAVADKLRRDNPARSPIITAPRAKHVPRESWAAERVWRVRDEHPEPYRALVDCAAGLGLRRGCAFALAEEDIDQDARKVTIRRQLAWIGGQWVFKLPKGGKERTVPLPRGVAAALEVHMAKFPPAEVTMPWMDELGVLGDPVKARLLFTWHGTRPGGPRGPKEAGRPIVAASYEQGVWKPALSRLGIIPPPDRTARGILRYRVGGSRGEGMHNLRHFYESMLDDGGVSLAGMMEFMGHSREGKVITIGVYGHVTEETFETARQAVDARLFRLRPVDPGGTVTELRAAR